MSAVSASTPAEWRAWLERNCASSKEIWLIIHHKGSATPSVRYHEAIEQALCFGWIDGLHRKHDKDSSRLRFTPRGPRSTWSAVNRERAARMVEQGLMTERGQAVIDLARAKGTWELTASFPEDLQRALAADKTAEANFATFPPSSTRLILEWIAGAKKPETRQRRIERTTTLAAQGIRANHPNTRTIT
ncbi:YdeI family protein [Allokutzneria sp. NRRL B-24872]|uniref:YdeI/OmpD-associated family protein n=1 Tax=Allokutzneria sp. NRRL B-24872 TaxID=1137961 RepID=UPI000A37F7FA|nr:YdeI/OmpD-associated family protein [Allokutzneria sp. NRRL B-24872]